MRGRKIGGETEVGTSGEVRHLQDSLSRFFTPTNQRRSRVAQSSFSLEGFGSGTSSVRNNQARSVESSKKRPLLVFTDDKHLKSRLPSQLSSSSYKSGLSTPSPHRRTDVLQDALSHYFSASTEKRRTFSKGQYVHLSGGRLRDKSGESSLAQEEFVRPVAVTNLQQSNLTPLVNEEFLQIGQDETKIEQHEQISRRQRSTTAVENKKMSPFDQNIDCQQASVSLNLKMADGCTLDEPSTSRALEDVKSSRKFKPILKILPTRNQLRTASILRRAKTHQARLKFARPNPATYKRQLVVALRQPDLTRIGTSNKALPVSEPVKITSVDQEMYDRAQKAAFTMFPIRPGCTKAASESSGTPHKPRAIRIGDYEIETWYSSPYPSEYARLPVLYICEYCLKYMRSSGMGDRHASRCQLFHPPGNEIYRNNGISVFEVDGNTSRIYCQNICLLAELFLEHKTLYYDVEPFLFYVLTKNDQYGCHFVGYFSKEKYSAQKYNLSCILTLPCYQKQGYGRFLIDFSFMLCRREGTIGTPERPLSSLGRLSYRSYWRTALLEHLYKAAVTDGVKRKTLKAIARETGISVFDVAETLQSLDILRKSESQLCVTLNMTMLKNHWNKARHDPKRIWLDESKLIWSPKTCRDVRSTTCSSFKTISCNSLERNYIRTCSFLTHEFGKKKGPNNSKKQIHVRKLMPKALPAKRLSDISSDDEILPGSISACKDVRRGRFWEKSSEDDDLDESDVHVKQQKGRNFLPHATTMRKRMTKRNNTNHRYRNRDAHKTATSGKISCSSTAGDDSSDFSDDLSRDDNSRKEMSRKYTEHSLSRVRRKRKLDVNHLEHRDKPIRGRSSHASATLTPAVDEDRKSIGVVESIELNNVAEGGRPKKVFPGGSFAHVKIKNRHNRQEYESISSSDVNSTDYSTDESLPILKRRKILSRAEVPSCGDDSSESLRDRMSPKRKISDDGNKSDAAADAKLLQGCAKSLELTVVNEDELPPTLEADGAAKACADQPIHLENKVQEVADEAGCSNGAYSNEMPLLRMNAVGIESAYEGEEEDAPPRLSPNFALGESSAVGSPKEHDSIPELSATIPSVIISEAPAPSAISTSNHHESNTRSASANTPRIAIANSTCEMVNLGGDAGSDGETSEAEQKDRCVSQFECQDDAHLEKLKTEPSALDRPPKAPAMLTLPSDEHDIAHTSNQEEKMANRVSPKGNTMEMVKPAVYNDDSCRQQNVMLSQSPSVVTASIHSEMSAQSFVSSTCSVQKPSSSDTAAITPHSQMEVSPNGEVFLGSNESNNLHSDSSTPHHVSSQPQHSEIMFNGIQTNEIRLNMLPGSSPLAPQKVLSSKGAASSSLPSHSSHRRSKKDQGRQMKSLNSQRPPVLLPPAPLAPYMLANPGASQTFATQAQNQAGLLAASTSYYPSGYAPTRHSAYFETQFHPGPLSGPAAASTAYQTSSASYSARFGGLAKAHSVGSSMQNNFAYSYPHGMQQAATNMGLSSGGAAVSTLTPQQMIGVQCPELSGGSSANASTSWRYPNGSAGFPNSFMDAFSSGMTSAPSGSQFSLPNQLYYQQYHPYLMPMMRND